MSLFARIVSSVVLFVSLAPVAAAQISQDILTKIDTAVASVYEAASVKLPCKLSNGANSRMLDWKDVDKCMERARLRVNWDELARQLIALRPTHLPEGDFAAAVEKSLERQALPYNKLFRVKSKNAFLPLTNSILKYALQDTLMGKPIFLQKGREPVGMFAGIFTYEKAGAMATGNTYRLSMFQYTDAQKIMETPTEKLLLDAYGVRWNDIESSPGFRFPVDMIPGVGRR
jgi:hypothetical protein